MDSQKSGQNCNSPPLSSTTGSAGCGCPSDITVNITPTTGGSWFIRVDPQTSIENFKKIVSKKLKVHKERICLLYRDKQLREGSLFENGLVDGSRLTLLPSVETGLLTQRPELSVMQALESLNDNQVNDFLSGKAPLNLTMRLGDHMMLIQLQLSTVTAGTSTTSTGTSTATTATNTTVSQQTTFTSQEANNTISNNLQSNNPINYTAPVPPSPSATLPTFPHHSHQHSSTSTSTTGTSLSSSSIRPRTSSRISAGNRQVLLSSLASALAVAKEEHATTTPKVIASPTRTVPETMDVTSTSPIQSLSDLATRPTVPVPTAARIPQSRSPPHSSSTADPIAAGLTSCLCRSLSPPCSCAPATNNTLPSQSPSSSAASMYDTPSYISSHNSSSQLATSPASPTRLDTRALAQASRNLTQTLRQLSTEVLSSREIEQRAQGAIIESMQHHGRGVYSGTFSGTLNPALQDSRGRPRRDISTIVHILNDLLCAAPPVRRTESSSPPPNITTNTNSNDNNNNIDNNSNAVTHPTSVTTESTMSTTTTTATSSPKPACDCPRCTDRCMNDTTMLEATEHLDSNAEQNSRTRDKIEQLRLVMGERRERRRLRKQKIKPYTIPSETQTSTDAVSA